MTKIDLNEGQKAAADAFFMFLFKEDEKEFIISGAAGVGKTALMGYLIDVIMPRYHESCELVGIKPTYQSVEMTATTNKAADVLGKATGRATSTIHSYMRLRVKEDFKTGKTNLQRNNDWMIHQGVILFIDEASMIDNELYTQINEGTYKSKIVYVGDHNQLAPVGEVISPVYTSKAPFVVLTEPMRNNKQPALMEICQQLRETVETQQFNPIHMVPGVIDRYSGDKMTELINNTFKTQNTNSRILAYTNNRVHEYNSHIRTIRGLTDRFEKGELLVNNRVMKIGPPNSSRMLSVEEDIEILEVTRDGELQITPEITTPVYYVNIKSGFTGYFEEVAISKDKEHVKQLMAYFKKNANWERFFYTRDAMADFRPREAATVHKAQGSTYDSVILDLTNIGTCNFPNQTARMLYVAFSRAREHVYVYGDLPTKYGGVIG